MGHAWRILDEISGGFTKNTPLKDTPLQKPQIDFSDLDTPPSKTPYFSGFWRIFFGLSRMLIPCGNFSDIFSFVGNNQHIFQNPPYNSTFFDYIFKFCWNYTVFLYIWGSISAQFYFFNLWMSDIPKNRLVFKIGCFLKEFFLRIPPSKG